MPTLTFEKNGHLYMLDGKPLTGVTSVLQVIAKPALIQWSANEAVNYIREKTKDLEAVGIQQLEIILEEARLAHRKKKEDAGSRGTDVHSLIEAEAKNAIENTHGFFVEKWKEQYSSRQVIKFIDWAVSNKVKFIASEKQVYSETHWLAGTLDFLCEINGKKYVGDIKTSSGIYGREYFAQCAAYRLMLEEQGETEFEGSVVVRLGKDGSFEEMYSTAYEEDKKLFLACLDVYRMMKTFEPKELIQQ